MLIPTSQLAESFLLKLPIYWRRASLFCPQEICATSFRARLIIKFSRRINLSSPVTQTILKRGASWEPSYLAPSCSVKISQFTFQKMECLSHKRRSSDDVVMQSISRSDGTIHSFKATSACHRRRRSLLPSKRRLAFHRSENLSDISKGDKQEAPCNSISRKKKITLPSDKNPFPFACSKDPCLKAPPINPSQIKPTYRPHQFQVQAHPFCLKKASLQNFNFLFVFTLFFLKKPFRHRGINVIDDPAPLPSVASLAAR